MHTKADFMGPVNLGNSSEFSMLELTEAIKEITGSQSKLIRLQLPDDDPKQRKPDISLALKVLDWKPQIDLKNGLQKTIKFLKVTFN
jgi:UDP-glucuronate decarboxylase